MITARRDEAIVVIEREWAARGDERVRAFDRRLGAMFGYAHGYVAHLRWENDCVATAADRSRSARRDRPPKKAIPAPRPPVGGRVTVNAVIDVTAYVAQISRDDLLSTKRYRHIAWPRQIAMMIARDLTPRSFPEIGRTMGGRDHSTIIHGARAAAARCEADPEQAALAGRVHARLTA